METFFLHPNTQVQLFHPKSHKDLDTNKFFTVQQRHTQHCVLLSNSKNDSITSIREKLADAMATHSLMLPMGIQTADCLSMVLSIGDKDRARSLLSIHAGWRGLLGGILEASIRCYKENLMQNEDEEVQIYIAPSIRKCCFEIQNDVIPEFDTWVKNHPSFLGSNYQASIPWLAQENQNPPNQAFVDLVGIAKFLLEENFSKHFNINYRIHPDCTKCSPNHWGSYRRNKSYVEKNWVVATIIS